MLAEGSQGLVQVLAGVCQGYVRGLAGGCQGPPEAAQGCHLLTRWRPPHVLVVPAGKTPGLPDMWPPWQE